MTSPTIDKYTQRELLPADLWDKGWRSGGFDCDSGLYMFSRRVGQGQFMGYVNVFANDEDLADGAKGLRWLIENGYTRVES